MHQYIILANPGHNRIYLDAALKISVSELMALSQKYELGIKNISETEGPLPASLQFSTDKELSDDDMKILGTSSIFYALFKQEGELLRALAVPDFHVFPESMVQILKYNGKTNEQFTRLLVNLALSSCETNSERRTLLDPVAGKGTTLYEALIRGFHVKGLEINDKWTHECSSFLQRYMQEGRYKHKSSKGNFNDEKGRKIASVFNLETAVDAQDYKNGDTQILQLFAADTRIADTLVKKRSCDMIVADLPYGVQHGSWTDKNSRHPIELIHEALPAWYPLLRSKGSMVLAYNELTLRRAHLAKALEEAGFTILSDAPYKDFSHRVDQSINRNVIVCVK